MEDWIGYAILGFGFCFMPLVFVGIAVFVIRRMRKPAGTMSITRATTTATPPARPQAGAATSRVSPVRATPTLSSGAKGDFTPLYLNFSNKPRAILDNMSTMVAQAEKVNATKTRWSKGPRLLFWLGLGLMLVEGLIFLLGYTPSCAFVTGGIALWVIGIVLSVSLKRSQVQAFPPQFDEFEKIVETLRDDLRPGSGFLGNLDLTGARQSSKVARAANDARGRTTNYYRDQWLNFKAKLFDGNILRVSGIQRLKERNGYWGRGKVSGKSKWKPAKFKGSYQELKVRIAVNSEMYKIVPNSEIKVDSQIGEYTINAVDTAGGIVTVLASSPREAVSAESVLGVLKSAYGLLQLKKA
ncbi:MAG: hypothetical protein HY867_13330 [Chloroflexi bacterium]|nr:hypothetical protein [Chloroflexota bacterium]